MSLPILFEKENVVACLSQSAEPGTGLGLSELKKRISNTDQINKKQ